MTDLTGKIPHQAKRREGDTMTNQDKPKHLTLVTDSLTGKQESFAQKVAQGAVLSDAYREAYSAENMKDSTVWSEACKLAQHPKVAARVKAIQADIEADHRTRAARREEYVLKRLQEEAEGAETDGARVRALELLGKSVSLFTDRVETDSQTERTASDIEAEILRTLDRLGGDNK